MSRSNGINPSRVPLPSPIVARRLGAWLRATTALVGCGMMAGAALAQPNQASVVAGQATIGQSGAATTIRQGTDKAIIDWRSFSTNPGESVTFVQPNAGSISLNRVTGAEASTLRGSLSANGQVMLVNPNGVLIGPTGTIDVNGLVATTSDIRNQDFLNGRHSFGQASGNPNATVVNQGRITTAPGGYAVLSAPGVANDGTITADVGTVVLGGAKTFTLDLNGDKLLSYAITGQVDQAPVGPDGTPVSALVSNSGAIQANGGAVTLTARAAKGIVDSVINTGGKIQATRAHGQGGVVVIDGDDGVQVGGAVLATGASSLDAGGSISVLGDKVAITSTASLDASGAAGGGTVKVGGDFKGAAGTRTASVTNVAKGATVKADATVSGNGGKVVVWSDQATRFDGAISAQALASGAQGGTVETSSKGALGITTGTVTTAAPLGKGGSWLLDPTDITIATGGIGDLSADIKYTPTASFVPTVSRTVSPSAITAALETGDIILVADVRAGAGAGTGAIIVNSPISYTGSANNRLSLLASGAITVNAAISVPMVTMTGDSILVSPGIAVTATAPRQIGYGPELNLSATSKIALSAGSTLSAPTIGLLVTGGTQPSVLAGVIKSNGKNLDASVLDLSVEVSEAQPGMGSLTISGTVDLGGAAFFNTNSANLVVSTGASVHSGFDGSPHPITIPGGAGPSVSGETPAVQFTGYSNHQITVEAGADISLAGSLWMSGNSVTLLSPVVTKGFRVRASTNTDTGDVGGFTQGAGATINAGSGVVILQSNKLTLNGGAGSIITTNSATVAVDDQNWTIGVGATSGSSQLNLSQSIVSAFTNQSGLLLKSGEFSGVSTIDGSLSFSSDTTIQGNGGLVINGATNITSAVGKRLALKSSAVTMAAGASITTDSLSITQAGVESRFGTMYVNSSGGFSGSTVLAGSVTTRGTGETFTIGANPFRKNRPDGVTISGTIDLGVGSATIYAGTQGITVTGGGSIKGTSNAAGIGMTLDGGPVAINAGASVSAIGGPISIIGGSAFDIGGSLKSQGFLASLQPGGTIGQAASGVMALGGGPVTLVADQLNLGGAAGSITAGSVTLLPTTDSASVGLGTATGDLTITNAMIGKFTGYTTLVVGSGVASGSVAIGGRLDLPAGITVSAGGAIAMDGTANLVAGSSALVGLFASDAVSLAPGSSISSGALSISTGASAFLGGSVKTTGIGAMPTFAVDARQDYPHSDGGVTIAGAVALGSGSGLVKAGSQGITLTGGGAITGASVVTSPVGFPGQFFYTGGLALLAAGGPISIDPGATVSLSSGSLYLAGALYPNGQGPTSISIAGAIKADGVSAGTLPAGSFTLGAGGSISAGTQGIGIAADAMSFNAGAGSVTSSGGIYLSAVSDSISVGLGTASGTLFLSTAALSSFSGSSYLNINAGGVSGAVSIAGAVSWANDLQISAGSSISVAAGTTITAGSTSALSLTSGNGGIALAAGSSLDAGSITIGSVVGTGGPILLAGALTARGGAYGSSLFISAGSLANGVTLTGAITLGTGFGTISSGSQGVTVANGARIVGGAGTTVLGISAKNGPILIDNGASVSLGNGSLSVGGVTSSVTIGGSVSATGVSLYTGSGGSITQAAGATIAAGSRAFDVNSDVIQLNGGAGSITSSNSFTLFPVTIPAKFTLGGSGIDGFTVTQSMLSTFGGGGTLKFGTPTVPVAIAGPLSLSGGLSVAGSSITWTGAITAKGAVTFNQPYGLGNVILSGANTIDTTAGGLVPGASISFSTHGASGAGVDLTLNAGIGDVFLGDLGSSAARLGNVTISSAGNVSGGSAYVAAFSQPAPNAGNLGFTSLDATNLATLSATGSITGSYQLGSLTLNAPNYANITAGIGASTGAAAAALVNNLSGGGTQIVNGVTLAAGGSPPPPPVSPPVSPPPPPVSPPVSPPPPPVSPPPPPVSPPPPPVSPPPPPVSPPPPPVSPPPPPVSPPPPPVSPPPPPVVTSPPPVSPPVVASPPPVSPSVVSPPPPPTTTDTSPPPPVDQTVITSLIVINSPPPTTQTTAPGTDAVTLALQTLGLLPPDTAPEPPPGSQPLIPGVPQVVIPGLLDILPATDPTAP